MNLIEATKQSPEQHLLLDETLLKKAEAGEAGEALRFWESDEYFVVLGRSGRAEEECHVEKCREDGIKILTRCSGGGTVLQGPGCFNYSLVLAYDRVGAYCNTPLHNVNESYRYILGRIREALRGAGCNVDFKPISDLTLDGKKISGNAQARKKRYFLHHGTFLVDFDIDMIEKYLKYPPKEPEYRRGRSHEDFLTNIPLDRDTLRGVIKTSL